MEISSIQTIVLLELNHMEHNGYAIHRLLVDKENQMSGSPCDIFLTLFFCRKIALVKLISKNIHITLNNFRLLHKLRAHFFTK
jgi:hypothetical protein